LKRVSTAQAIGAFIASRRAANAAPATITWYTYMLRPLERAHKALPDRPEQLESVLAGLVGYSAASKVDHYKAMRIFYRWTARRIGWPNAMEEVRQPLRRKTLPKALTDLQIDQLLWNARTRPRDHALLTLLLDTGARIGEAASLSRRDVLTGAPGEHAVRLSGKTGDRMVPISDETHRALAKLPWHARHLWLTRTGKPASTDLLTKSVRAALRRANIHGGPHALRHTFGKLYVMHGGDLFSLQRLLGHSQISTTRIYVELAQADLQIQHAKFSPIARRFTVLDGGRAAAASS
jgi:site-specific recombinase XerD